MFGTEEAQPAVKRTVPSSSLSLEDENTECSIIRMTLNLTMTKTTSPMNPSTVSSSNILRMIGCSSSLVSSYR